MAVKRSRYGEFLACTGYPECRNTRSLFRDQEGKVRAEEVELTEEKCPKCGGMIKTDGVAFGEPIPSDVAHKSLEEAWKCDLMLICGTSAVVYPFANLPRVARQREMEKERRTAAGIFAVGKVPAVTIIEINAEPTPLTESAGRSA
jgi:NAD-dependent SIR2 family protein deacetylase